MRSKHRVRTGPLIGKLKNFLSAYMTNHPALRPFTRSATILLHGSAAEGVHDRWSDLDIWIWVSRRELRSVDAKSPTRFFEFVLGRRPGHANAEAREEVLAKVRACDLGHLHQIRHAVILQDPSGFGRKMINLARRPMRPGVRRTLFFNHYVEMRGYHRNLDNPLNRGDRAAVFIALGTTLTHALRAAMILDGEVPPYDKWLAKAAVGTRTGRVVAKRVSRIMRMVGQGALNRRQGEKRHPVNLELRKIRADLIAAAHLKGIREQWLNKWYLSIDQAREARARVRW